MKRVVLGFAILMLVSCGAIPKKETVRAILTPLHNFSAVKPKPNIIAKFDKQYLGQSWLVDNDGNEYWQYWDLREKIRAEFDKTVKRCKKITTNSKLNYNRIAVSEVKLSHVIPSIYKEFTKCISDAGYNYITGDGFYPVKFRLSMSRGFSGPGKYRRVAGIFYITKKNVQLSEVLADVRECENEILKTKDKGIKEVYFGGYVSVSIEPYARSMLFCMKGRSYIVKSNKVKKFEPL